MITTKKLTKAEIQEYAYNINLFTPVAGIITKSGRMVTINSISPFDMDGMTVLKWNLTSLSGSEFTVTSDVWHILPVLSKLQCAENEKMAIFALNIEAKEYMRLLKEKYDVFNYIDKHLAFDKDNIDTELNQITK